MYILRFLLQVEIIKVYLIDILNKDGGGLL